MQSLLEILFFFSSRRRHTRLQGDWSSDVCSSDLERAAQAAAHGVGGIQDREEPPRAARALVRPVVGGHAPQGEIGRASCRERVEIAAVGGAVKRRREEGQRKQQKEEEEESESAAR